MQDIERILTDADVNAEAHIPLISILHAHPAERPSA